MNFSYDRAWADVMAMARANIALLATLAGAFLFLPSFALLLFAPMPAPPSGGDGSQAITMLLDYYRTNAFAFFAVTLVSTVGQVAMLSLLLDRGRPTVADALSTAGKLILPYIGLTILANLALMAGFALFIVPGIYLLGRLAVAGSAMVAERNGNPLDALRRTWALTTGRGWRIAGFMLLVALVGWIALSAATSVIGVAAGLLLPDGGKLIVSAAADALGGAGLGLLLVLLAAAIYRQLAGADERLGNVFN